MKEFFTVRFNFSGGIVSPGELRDILSALKACSVQNVKFGLRQQMICKLAVGNKPKFVERMEAIKARYYLDENPYPNIVTSYVAEEVFLQANWLSEGIYKDVLDAFDFDPKVKINISDSRQSFTPFFSGHINFISSEQPNFWHLFVRLPKSNEVVAYHELVFSNELAAISRFLEQRLLKATGEPVFEKLPRIISKEKTGTFALPRFTLPYYEGFNRYGKKSWLGIYRREEKFDINFLIDLCSLCLSTKIGEICLTPWKSIIIKNIEEKDRKSWSGLLAKYDINVRHAANELNWQIEDDSPEAMALKLRLTNYFNQMDLRTFGLCLGIKTVPQTEVFASVMVRQKKIKWLPLLKLYDITYTTDYDPNGRTVVAFSKNVPGIFLPERLRQSILQYNKHVAAYSALDFVPGAEEKQDVTITNKWVHQCRSCLSVYDSEYGDILQDILPGIAFEELSEDYCCGICGEEKQQFTEIEFPLN
jgi:rubredoxin